MTEHYKRTATELAEMISTGQVTAREVCEDALARLAAVNPAINAVVQEMPEEALAAADAVDGARAAGQKLGPLGGVPVTVKVNVDQKGFATTNGLLTQKDLVATEDSAVVAALRKSGAVIVGRTNTPAFSMRWFTRNRVHGATKNPRNPALTPGGSSGGASAACAAGIGAIAHGSDIAGSIRYPAYVCGIHGLRPSTGRVPVYNPTAPDRLIGGQIMAVQGPLARSVADLKVAFEAMSIWDPRDPYSAPMPHRLPDLPRRAALCVAPDGMNTVPEVEAALRSAADALKAAGWEVTEVDTPPIRECARLNSLLWMEETRRTDDEAIYAEDDPDANAVFGQWGVMGGEASLNALRDALKLRSTHARTWQQFLDTYPVLLCPVSAELPFRDHRDVESPEEFAACYEANLLQCGLPLMGLPGLTVTTGLTGSTPVGVQLVANRFREDVLLDAGALIEAAHPVPMPVDPAV
ncbi:MAG: amidase family protein [Pseudomonadota bacterium]